MRRVIFVRCFRGRYGLGFGANTIQFCRRVKVVSGKVKCRLPTNAYSLAFCRYRLFEINYFDFRKRNRLTAGEASRRLELRQIKR